MTNGVLNESQTGLFIVSPNWSYVLCPHQIEAFFGKKLEFIAANSANIEKHKLTPTWSLKLKWILLPEKGAMKRTM